MFPALVIALVLLTATGVHELGHLVAARARRARVVRVSVGRGPRVVAFRRGQTVYELRLLPIGGRVDYHTPGTGTANAVIAVGGAVANVAAGFLLLWAAAMRLGPDRMPFGDSALDPLHYATAATAAWLRIVPATIAEFLAHGRSRTLGLGVDAIVGLLEAPSVANGLHAVAAVSVVWGVLNMIPIPWLRTDGWQFLIALVARRAARQPQASDFDSTDVVDASVAEPGDGRTSSH